MPVPKEKRDAPAEYQRAMAQADQYSEQEVKDKADQLLALTAKKGGRPSGYTDAKAKEIIERIINGETLAKICKSRHLPSRAGVYWWQRTIPWFRDALERARTLQGESWGERAVDEALADPKDKVSAMHARTRTDTLLKAAGRRDPERWGDKPAPGAGVQVVINTNLGLDSTLQPGVLVAHASDNGPPVERGDKAEPQVIENKSKKA